MRLSEFKKGDNTYYRIVEDVPKLDGKYTTVIIESLGSTTSLRKKYPDRDPREFAEDRLAELQRIEAEKEYEIIPKLSSSKRIPLDKKVRFRGGYLFIQQLFYALGLGKLCKNIASRYKFEYNLAEILCRLVDTRIIEPGSKLSSLEVARSYLEQPTYELHDIYRALEIIAKENNLIQEQVYKESKKLIKRNDKILFYDCTNYFFEIEEEDELRKYGHSKDHKPNPLVQMGLFLDGSGYPLAFSINSGNTNEQITLKPLEKQIMRDFKLAHFVVCTDAGLSSMENRKFNDMGQRAFVTTQSIKKLKSFLQEWALSPEGWQLPGSKKKYSLTEIDPKDQEELKKVYYKTRWINEGGLEQKLMVSFSLKYKNYLTSIRDGQIVRAQKKLEKPSSLKKKRPNDPARFVKEYPITETGELACDSLYLLDEKTIEEEAKYDGFYAICTNLEAEPHELIAINKQRWQIEEAFRILKSEFEARPVFLQRQDRILAHFTTCFLALLIFKILKAKLKEKLPNTKFTNKDLIQVLKEMNFHQLNEGYYVPSYTRNQLIDALHELSGFRTDYEVIRTRDLKKIIKLTKKK